MVVFMFFVLVSSGFWLLQTLNDSYDTSLHFPLQLENIPEGVVITTELPKSITVTVRDRGTTLMSYILKRRKASVVSFDFSIYDKGTAYGRVILPHSEVQKLVEPFLESTTRILGLSPDTLEFYYSRGKKKRVPVQFNGHVETGSLYYYLVSLQCEPDSVTVWAEEHYLDSLTAVTTVPIHLDSIKENVSQMVQLQRKKGMKLEPEEVLLKVTVDSRTTKEVEVPIVGTNFPAGYVLRTFPSVTKITFNVGMRDYRKITAESFVITATYEELMARHDSIMYLHLRSIPEGVSNVKIQPESVQFLIEQTEE